MKYDLSQREYKGDGFSLMHDFWHWFCDQYSVEGVGFYTMYESDLDRIEEPSIKEVVGYFLQEFAEDGEIEFWVDSD